MRFRLNSLIIAGTALYSALLFRVVQAEEPVSPTRVSPSGEQRTLASCGLKIPKLAPDALLRKGETYDEGLAKATSHGVVMIEKMRKNYIDSFLTLSTGGVTQVVRYPRESHGYPIFPPEFYAKTNEQNLKKALQFDPRQYHCHKPSDVLFWRQSVITEYYPREDGKGESVGRHTNSALTPVEKHVADLKQVQSGARDIGEVSYDAYQRGARGVKSASVAGDSSLGMSQVFVPGIDFKLNEVPKADAPSDAAPFAPISFRMEDTGASENFENPGHPILDYPLSPDGSWSGVPKTVNNRAIGATGSFRLDVRVIKEGSIKTHPSEAWWIGICVSEKSLSEAEAARTPTRKTGAKK